MEGIWGTPAVLFGVGGVLVLQAALTYLPPMNQIFETRPLSPVDASVTVSVGVALFVLLEVEKQLQRRWNPNMRRTIASVAGIH